MTAKRKYSKPTQQSMRFKVAGRRVRDKPPRPDVEIREDLRRDLEAIQARWVEYTKR